LEDDEQEEDGDDDPSSSCYSSSSNDHDDDHGQPLTHHQAATNMIQTTLECGIASICRLRQLYPRHFFSKMDVEGTSVTRFDLRVLEECVVVASGERMKQHEGWSLGEKTTTLSPLTATQRTHRTALGDGCRDDDDEDDDTFGNEKNERQATEALLLLRWIGTKGVHSILKRNQLARVILGIMVPKKKEDELVEQYVVCRVYPMTLFMSFFPFLKLYLLDTFIIIQTNHTQV